MHGFFSISHCLSIVEFRPSSSLSTGCVVSLRGDWAIFCHAGSGRVGRVRSARWKSLEILRRGCGNWTRVTGRTDSELSHWAIMTDWHGLLTENSGATLMVQYHLTTNQHQGYCMQGLVLRPLLFLLCINDLLIHFSCPLARIHLFVDYVLLHRPIETPRDSSILQDQLQLEFNATKCTDHKWPLHVRFNTT